MFAFILFTYFIEGYSLYSLIAISAAMFVITISKDSGFGLALISLFIIFLDSILFKKKDLREFLIKRKKYLSVFARSILIMLPILSLLVSKYSWKIHLFITHTISDRPSFSFSDVFDIAKGLEQPYQRLTIVNFINAIFDKTIIAAPIFTPASLFTFMLLFLLCSHFIINKNLCSYKRLKVAIIALFVAGFVYMGYLLLLYVFAFSQYEAPRLASYNRYLGTYLLGVVTFLFVLATTNGKKEVSKSSLFITLTLVLLLSGNSIPFIKSVLLSSIHNRNTVKIMEPYAKIQKYKEYIVPDKDILCMVSQGDDGPDVLRLLFFLTPPKIKTESSYSFSLKPYYPGVDPWTVIINHSDWGRYILEKCTKVYVFRSDENFKTTYGSYFYGGITEGKLYSVNKMNNILVLQGVKEK